MIFKLLIELGGGGDSFSAALIYSLITEKSNRDSIEFAVAASCLKHTIEGDYNRTTIEDIERVIYNGGNGRVQR